MVVVSVIIENTSRDKNPETGRTQNLRVECNLLKREDANNVEWQIAKGIEAMAEVSLKAMATKIHKMERID
jgi:hypothetical protein